MEKNVLVNEETDHGRQKKVVEMGVKESLEAVVKFVLRDDAKEFMSNSLDYIKNKMDELSSVVQDLQQFFTQNSDLAILLDPALVVSFSLMDLDGGMEAVVKNIATKQAADRDYKVEAVFGRNAPTEIAVKHLVGQMLD